MAEAQLREVNIERAESDRILECMLRCLYSISAMETVDEREVGPLYRLADYLVVMEVIDACNEYMLRRCCHENALFFFFNTHDTLKGEAVAAKCKRVIMTQFDLVSSHQDFLGLSAPQLEWLLASDDMCVASEITVFHALARWAASDVGRRTPDLAKLLQLVRFPMMTMAELGSIVRHSIGARERSVFSDLLLEAFESHMCPGACHEGGRFRPRGCMDSTESQLQTCTWNSHDKAAEVELAEGGLVACALGSCGAVRATVGFELQTAQRVYWEVESVDVDHFYAGVARPDAVLSNGWSAPCFDDKGWAVSSTGKLRHGTSDGQPLLEGFGSGDRMGILCHEGDISLYKNGRLCGHPDRKSVV